MSPLLAVAFSLLSVTWWAAGDNPLGPPTVVSATSARQTYETEDRRCPRRLPGGGAWTMTRDRIAITCTTVYGGHAWTARITYRADLKHVARTLVSVRAR